MEIKGKTFIVTGGASGLGAACVKGLSRLGANVVVVDMASSQLDVTKEQDVQSAIDRAWDDFQGLHGAINCAGIGTPCRVVDKDGKPHSLEFFSKVIGVNLIGTFNVIRLVAASMMNRGLEPGKERGVIINTASIAALEGQIGQAAYSASKGGIAAMTLPLARELARHGIRVMTISPGIFDTPMLAGLSEEVRTSLGQQVPYPPRLGRPEEFAALATHIIENEMLNGEVIRLDGALRMAPK